MTASSTSIPSTASVRRAPGSLPPMAYPIGLGVAVFAVAFVLLVWVLGIHALWPAILLGIGAGAVLWSRSDGMVLASTGAVPADAEAHARFLNVVDGLGAASGLADPALYVIDDDALNALAFGRSPRQSALVVTTGLLGALDRMELEAVVAHIVSLVKSETTPSGTFAAVTRIGRPRLGEFDEDVHVLADLDAVELTRYPPGLVAALEKLEGANTAVRRDARSTAHLWLASPVADESASRHQPLDQRIALLRER